MTDENVSGKTTDRETTDSDGDPSDTAGPSGASEETVPNGELHPNAWKRTVADMRSIATAREDEDDWDVVVLEPHRTLPLDGEDDHYDVFGFLHSVDDEDDVEAFRNVFDRSTFPRYEVYRTAVEDSVFFVTELFDPEAGTDVLIAGRYEPDAAIGMFDVADQEGELYTHVETPDEELAGAVQHGGYEKFVPEGILDTLDIGPPEI